MTYQSGMKAISVSLTSCPCRYGRGKVAFKFSLVNWAKQPEIAKAWAEIAAKHDLVYQELTDIDRIFGFGDRMFARGETFIMR